MAASAARASKGGPSPEQQAKTVESLFESARELLANVSEELEIDDGKAGDKNGKLHGMGSLVVTRSKRSFHETMQLLMMAANTREAWGSQSDALATVKADVVERQTRLSRVTQGVASAALDAGRGDTFASPQERRMRELLSLAKRTGAQCFMEESTLHDMGGTRQWTVTICGKAFLADIYFSQDAKDGRVPPRVDFRHVLDRQELRDQVMGAEISAHIVAEEYTILQKAIEYMLSMERIEIQYTAAGENINRSLIAFETDLLQMRAAERIASGEIPYQRLALGHGLMTRTLFGVRLGYHLDKADVLRYQQGKSFKVQEASSGLSNLSMDTLVPPSAAKAMHSVTLGVEDAPKLREVTTTSRHPTVASSHMSWPLVFDFQNVSSVDAAFQFVLTLDNPLIVSRSLAFQLRSLYGAEQGSLMKKAMGNSACLQALLMPAIFGLPEDREKRDVMFTATVSLPDESRLKFCHNTEDLTLGIALSRVPINSPQDVAFVLTRLRQQAVFNELFRSCFRERPTLEATRKPETIGGAQQVDVVVADAPEFIHVVLVDNSDGAQDSQWGMGVTINLNGDIKVKMQAGEDSSEGPPCTHERATELLNASRDIALTIHFIRKLSRRPKSTRGQLV